MKRYYDFLAADISVNDNTTATDGTEFTSKRIPVKPSEGALTVKFKPAVPAAQPVTFEFLASYDKGTTWTSKVAYSVAINSNEELDADSVVIALAEQTFRGITHLKLNKVIVGSGAGNCTLINASVSFVAK